MASTVKRNFSGVVALGGICNLVYYQHLEDTGGDEPFKLMETRAVRAVKRYAGNLPPEPSYRVIHGGSEFIEAVLR